MNKHTALSLLPQLHCANGTSIFIRNPNTASQLGKFHKDGGTDGTAVDDPTLLPPLSRPTGVSEWPLPR
ncbi:MAG: hypothetical protein ACPG76_01530, partial [Arenicellales bacterium]